MSEKTKNNGKNSTQENKTIAGASTSEKARCVPQLVFDAFIFDLDGTLLDTLPDLVVITNTVLAKMNFPLRTHDEILSYVGNGVRALMYQAVPEGTPEAQTEEAMEHWKGLFPFYKNDLTKPYSGMPEVLAELKAQGVKLGVLSNKFDAGVQQVMNQFMPGLFVVMHGEGEGVPRKPDPTGLLRTISEMGSTPQRSAYVGDSPGDIMVAQNAGVFAIGVSWGYHYGERLREAGADVVINFPEELLQYAASL